LSIPPVNLLYSPSATLPFRGVLGEDLNNFSFNDFNRSLTLYFSDKLLARELTSPSNSFL